MSENFSGKSERQTKHWEYWEYGSERAGEVHERGWIKTNSRVQYLYGTIHYTLTPIITILTTSNWTSINKIMVYRTRDIMLVTIDII